MPSGLYSALCCLRRRKAYGRVRVPTVPPSSIISLSFLSWGMGSGFSLVREAGSLCSLLFRGYTQTFKGAGMGPSHTLRLPSGERRTDSKKKKCLHHAFRVLAIYQNTPFDSMTQGFTDRSPNPYTVLSPSHSIPTKTH